MRPRFILPLKAYSICLQLRCSAYDVTQCRQKCRERSWPIALALWAWPFSHFGRSSGDIFQCGRVSRRGGSAFAFRVTDLCSGIPARFKSVFLLEILADSIDFFNHEE